MDLWQVRDTRAALKLISDLELALLIHTFLSPLTSFKRPRRRHRNLFTSNKYFNPPSLRQVKGEKIAK